LKHSALCRDRTLFLISTMKVKMSKTVALLALSIGLTFAQSAPSIQPNVTFCNWAGLRCDYYNGIFTSQFNG
jgi:hypothetical protein